MLLPSVGVAGQPIDSFRRPQVALRFHMHTEVAGMWRREAQSILQPIIEGASAAPVRAASSPIRRSPSSGAFADAASADAVTSVPVLRVSPELKDRLTSAMHSMAHSAEYYLQVRISG